ARRQDGEARPEASRQFYLGRNRRLLTSRRSRRKIGVRASQRLARPSRIEGIGPFHCEAGLTDLRRIRRSNAGELCLNVVNDVEVAVRAVVISQTQIGADRLRV